jgi:hypothetical protein
MPRLAAERSDWKNQPPVGMLYLQLTARSGDGRHPEGSPARPDRTGAPLARGEARRSRPIIAAAPRTDFCPITPAFTAIRVSCPVREAAALTSRAGASLARREPRGHRLHQCVHRAPRPQRRPAALSAGRNKLAVILRKPHALARGCLEGWKHARCLWPSFETAARQGERPPQDDAGVCYTNKQTRGHARCARLAHPTNYVAVRP